MSADIANWLQVNIVNNPQILQSLIALIILIVASFLMSEKPTKKIPSKRILGAALFVFAIFIFLYANIASLANVFTVWATLVLAGVAVFSFEESRRLRKENRQREERERKERLLNEIIKWAENISKCGIEPGIELYLDYRIAGAHNYITTEIEDDEGKPEKVIAAEIKHRKQLLSQYLRYSKKIKYMCKIAPNINKLDNDMREVVKNLEDQIELLRKSLLDIENTTTTDISLQMDKLVKSTENLIEQATDLKTKDIS